MHILYSLDKKPCTIFAIQILKVLFIFAKELLTSPLEEEDITFFKVPTRGIYMVYRRYPVIFRCGELRKIQIFK